MINEKLEREMETARKVVEAGQAERKITGVKVRIPLANLNIKTELPTNLELISNEVWEVVIKELNIKNITVNDKFHYPKVTVKVTKEQLEKEGKLRELIREIQSIRKLKNLRTDESIELVVSDEFESEKDFIAKRVLAKKISFGDKTEVI
jgi:valyl-tRNA synthetase